MKKIVEIIGEYTEVRQRRDEWWGLCPFHSERTPSFHVNEDKELWFCFSCQEGGDLLSFIMKAEGLTFPQAKSHLGIDPDSLKYRPQPRPHFEAANDIINWGESMSREVAGKLRSIGMQIALSKELTDPALRQWQYKSLHCQWELLQVVDDDLSYPPNLVELYKQREIIERLVRL